MFRYASFAVFNLWVFELFNRYKSSIHCIVCACGLWLNLIGATNRENSPKRIRRSCGCTRKDLYSYYIVKWWWCGWCNLGGVWWGATTIVFICGAIDNFIATRGHPKKKWCQLKNRYDMGVRFETSIIASWWDFHCAKHCKYLVCDFRNPLRKQPFFFITFVSVLLMYTHALSLSGVAHKLFGYTHARQDRVIFGLQWIAAAG